MADVSLKIKSDFEQAQKDFENLIGTSENARKKIASFTEAFKAEQIDKFSDRNRLAAIAVEATSGKFASMQTESKGLQREIERLIKLGLSPQDENLKKLTTSYDKLQGEITSVTRETANQSASFADGIKKIASYAAAYLSFQAAKETVKALTISIAEHGDAIQEASQKMGVSAESLQELQYAAKLAGVDSEALTNSFTKLNKNLGELQTGSGALTQTLKSSNPVLLEQLRHTNDSEKAFNLLVNAIDKTKDPFQKAKLAQEAFGKSGADLIPLMEGGTASLDALRQKAIDLGNVMSNESVEASAKFMDAQDSLKEVLKGVAMQMGVGMLEPLTNLMNGFIEWSTTGDNLKDTLSAIGLVITGLIGGYAAYVIATNAAIFSTGVFATGINLLTTALARNPFTALAVAATTVLIPALILLYKNWDLVGFKINDFAIIAKIKLLEVGNAINGVISYVSSAAKEQVIANNKQIESLQNLRNKNFENFTATQNEVNLEIQNRKINFDDAKIKNTDLIKLQTERFNEYKTQLGNVALTENQTLLEREQATKTFFENRAKLESIDGSERIKFLQSQYKEIDKIVNLSVEERKAAERGLTDAIKEEHLKLANDTLSAFKTTTNNLANIGQSLETIIRNTNQVTIDGQTQLSENGKKKLRELAVAQKAIAVSQAIINTALAVTAALTIPVAGEVLAVAAGIAGGIQVAAILSTPIPSAQTGIDYIVPDIAQFKNDKHAVNASAGERVSITPRGEDKKQDIEIDIKIQEEPIFKIIQRGMTKGRFNLNDNQIGRAIFV